MKKKEPGMGFDFSNNDQPTKILTVVWKAGALNNQEVFRGMC
ncbi:MAG: hypothetical protein AB7S72_05875 [Draconibacterium sp.]